jgi:hypothetical protein
MIQQAAKERRRSGHAGQGADGIGGTGLRKRGHAVGNKEQDLRGEDERILGDECGGDLDRECDGNDENEDGGSGIDSGTDDEQRRREEPDERTPLFGLTGQRGGREVSVDKDGLVRRVRRRMLDWGAGIGASAKKTRKEDIVDVGKTAVASIPAVILGSVLEVIFVFSGRSES